MQLNAEGPQAIDADRVVVDAVEKSFGETPVLRGVSLEVERQEVVVIIGASGSGKTTLLRCIAGLEPIQSGRISIFGTRCAGPGGSTARSGSSSSTSTSSRT